MQRTKFMIYGVYDTEDTPVYTGTGKQCAEFLGVSLNCIRDAVYRGYKVKRKYRIYSLYKEFNDTKICLICKKEKDISEFVWRPNLGTYASHCRECRYKYNLSR